MSLGRIINKVTICTHAESCSAVRKVLLDPPRAIKYLKHDHCIYTLSNFAWNGLDRLPEATSDYLAANASLALLISMVCA